MNSSEHQRNIKGGTISEVTTSTRRELLDNNLVTLSQMPWEALSMSSKIYEFSKARMCDPSHFITPHLKSSIADPQKKNYNTSLQRCSSELHVRQMHSNMNHFMSHFLTIGQADESTLEGEVVSSQ
jgi:hypothetical protein